MKMFQLKDIEYVPTMTMERRAEDGGTTRALLWGVPRFLINAFEWLEAHGAYDMEGLFRIDGVSRRIGDPLAVFRGSSPIPSECTVFDVCTMIKRFFRQLTPPLFDQSQTEQLRKMVCTLRDNREMCVNAVFAVLGGVPNSHIAILGYVMRQLKRVAGRAARNKMTVSNLAVVFAPCIFRDDPLPPPVHDRKSHCGRAHEAPHMSQLRNEREKMDAQIAVLKLLINYSDHLGVIVQREEEPRRPTYESIVSSPFVESKKSFAQIVNASSAEELLPPTPRPLKAKSSSFCNRPSVMSIRQNNKGLVEGRCLFFSSLSGNKSQSRE